MLELVHPLPIGNYQIYLTEKPPFPYLEVNQVHHNHLWVVGEEPSPESADGMVVKNTSNTSNTLPLCIKTADCLPVIILGHQGVAAIHAGWRSVHLKIFHHPALKEIEPYYVFLGPSIKQCCYKVGPEFLDYFGTASILNLHFDLAGTAIAQIKERFTASTITFEVSPLCTCCSTNPRLNSHRRDNLKLRNYNVFTVNR